MPTVFSKQGKFFVALAALDPNGSALQALKEKHAEVFQRGAQGFDAQPEAEKYRDELKALFQNARTP